MGRSQRTKGMGGERELAKLISEQLHVDVERRLGQERDSGPDLDFLWDDCRWYVEVKRRAQRPTEGDIRGWFKGLEGWMVDHHHTEKPCWGIVAFRQDRGTWRFVVPLPWRGDTLMAELPLDEWLAMMLQEPPVLRAISG